MSDDLYFWLNIPISHVEYLLVQSITMLLLYINNHGLTWCSSKENLENICHFVKFNERKLWSLKIQP